MICSHVIVRVIKCALGIASPSRHKRAHGEAIEDGFASGLGMLPVRRRQLSWLDRWERRVDAREFGSPR